VQTSYLSFGSTGLLLNSQVISGAGVPSTSHSIVAVSPSGTKISVSNLMNLGGVPDILGDSKRGDARGSKKFDLKNTSYKLKVFNTKHSNIACAGHFSCRVDGNYFVFASLLGQSFHDK
jgi:hypothetical protein